MTWTPIAPIRFVWWNTSLAPPVKRKQARATDEEIAFVIRELAATREALGADVIGLGEVNQEKLDLIMAGLKEPYLSSMLLDAPSKHVVADTALIYDRRKLTYVDHMAQYGTYGRTRLKTGHRVSFVVEALGERLHLIISHWPSRNTFADCGHERAKLGSALYDFANELREAGDDYIVLMGDYNDDPFSPSLSEFVLATRDRELARRQHDFFYNPFWRRVGESLIADHEVEDRSICGTYYYHQGSVSRWSTYDQIIYSSAFLNDKSMAIFEQHSEIVASNELLAAVRGGGIFDHLPVVGAISLRSQS